MLTPFEAALVNSQVEAGMVEILASTAFPVTLSAVNPTPPNEEIVLLDVNKNPKQMLMALSEGKPLRACRDAFGKQWSQLATHQRLHGVCAAMAVFGSHARAGWPQARKIPGHCRA